MLSSKSSFLYTQSFKTFVAITGIILCALKFTFGLSDSIDIGLWDESNYLWWGINFKKQYIAAENGPFYCLWYGFLHIFQSDKIRLYYLNYHLVTVLPAILLFLTLKVYGRETVICFLIAVFFLSCNSNLPVWPKISHFLLCFILLGAILIKLAKPLLTKLLVITTAALICGYIRPEYYYSFMLLGVLSGVVLLVQLIRRKTSFYPLACLVALLAAAFLLTKSIGVPTGGERGLLAFGQHFSLNYVDWYATNYNPFIDWSIILEQAFGRINTMGDALKNNPLMFYRHVFSNFNRYCTLEKGNLQNVLFPSFFFYESPHQTAVLVLKVILACSFLYVLLKLLTVQASKTGDGSERLAFFTRTHFVLNYGALAEKFKKFSALVVHHDNRVIIDYRRILAELDPAVQQMRRRYLNQLKSNSLELLILLVLISPTLVACLLIYPRDHYVIMQLPVFLLILSTIAPIVKIPGPSTIRDRRYSLLLLIGVILVTLRLTPTIQLYYNVSNPTQLVNKLSIKTLKELNITKPALLLEMEGGYVLYLGPNFSSTQVYQKKGGFLDWMKQDNINIVYVSPTLANDIRLVNDEQWKEFVGNFERYNFTKVPIPESDRYLLVQKTLL